jgi:hypothetical protein
MIKGYPEKPLAPIVPEPKDIELKTKGHLIAAGTGVAIGLAVAFAAEALLVWVILAYLMKVKLAYLQVLGAVILGEYVLGRAMLKNNELK